MSWRRRGRRLGTGQESRTPAGLRRGLARGTTDFSAILTRVRATTPDAFVAATYFEDAVAITRQMKPLNMNPKMYAVTVGSGLPKFHEVLGRTAEFVYGASQS